MNEKTQKQLEKLKITLEAYKKHILCGLYDPYLEMMKQRAYVIAGSKDSNLFAMVRIKNSGKEAINYRRIANKILFNDKLIQMQINDRFKDKFIKIEFFKNKNPSFVDLNGTVQKSVWHHSPNHILSVSLILEETHRIFRKSLHYDGKKGGNAMYSIKLFH